MTVRSQQQLERGSARLHQRQFNGARFHSRCYRSALLLPLPLPLAPFDSEMYSQKYGYG